MRGRPRESSAGLGGRIRRQGAAIHVDNERVNGEMVRGRRGRLLPDQSPPSSLLPTIPAEFRCRPSQRGKALADRKADSGGFVSFSVSIFADLRFFLVDPCFVGQREPETETVQSKLQDWTGFAKLEKLVSKSFRSHRAICHRSLIIIST